jgi:hypothetical protein
MKPAKYFMAVSEEDIDGYTMYPLYFVNNSPGLIERMIMVRRAALEKVKGITRISEIKDDLIDDLWVKRFLNIPPHSYIEDGKFHNWEFDWQIERLVFLKVGGKEERLQFTIKRYFITNTKTDNIPVLNKSGWICL